MKTYTEVNENITVIVAPHGTGWTSFTTYTDAETKPFVSYVAQHATREEAEARALRLIAKFI